MGSESREFEVLAGEATAPGEEETEPVPRVEFDPEAEGELAPGLAIGEFVIDRKVARGGMGTVYAAYHPVIGKKAAIKVISRRLTDDDDATARFVREARAVNQIGHPNIVDIFSFGQLPRNRHYYVMEWLEGKRLGALLGRGALGLTKTLAILDPICDALAAAHENGIVHRDLKPDNVMIAEGRRGQQSVKLLDFGIAKLNACAEGPMDTPTRTGMVLGTPEYISPEQARGRDVDRRADVYALGVMIFEMLTGKRPFIGESPVDTVSLHLHQPAPQISSEWPEVPAVLDALVLRMMAKSVDDRPELAEVRAVIAMLQSSGSAATRVSTARGWPGNGEAHASTQQLDGEELAFEQTLPEFEPVTPTTEKVGPGRSRVPAVLAIAALVALALVAGAWFGSQWLRSDSATSERPPVAEPQSARPEPAPPSVTPVAPAPSARALPAATTDGFEDAAEAGGAASAEVSPASEAASASDTPRKQRHQVLRPELRHDDAPKGDSEPTSAVDTDKSATPASDDKDADRPPAKPDDNADLDYMLDPFGRR